MTAMALGAIAAIPNPMDTSGETGLDPFGAFLSRHAGTAGRGPLAHVRLCVKDNIAVAGEPFTAGHPVFAGRRAAETAPAVQRLLDAGAAFVGMTRTDAGGFGMTTPGVANPVEAGRSVGGSSGGAAAAVAAGLADLGLGTDTGGSIRVPAAATGLFGFKPSRGSVPLEGVWPLAPSFDHVGLLARDLDLIRAAVPILLADSAAGAASPDRLRLAVEERMPDLIDPGIRSAFERVVEALGAAGHDIVRFDLPDRLASAAAFGAVVVAEAAPLYLGMPADGLGEAAARALRGAASADVAAARTRLAAAARRYDACLADSDALLSPTLFAPMPARGVHHIETGGRRWPLLAATLSATAFANVLGAPSLAMPLPACPGIGLPLGAAPFSLHLTGRPGHDLALLGMAERIRAGLSNMAM